MSGWWISWITYGSPTFPRETPNVKTSGAKFWLDNLQVINASLGVPALGSEWREVAREDLVGASGLPFAFVTYRRASA
jgi:hypothetical protein